MAIQTLSGLYCQNKKKMDKVRTSLSIEGSRECSQTLLELELLILPSLDIRNEKNFSKDANGIQMLGQPALSIKEPNSSDVKDATPLTITEENTNGYGFSDDTEKGVEFLSSHAAIGDPFQSPLQMNEQSREQQLLLHGTPGGCSSLSTSHTFTAATTKLSNQMISQNSVRPTDQQGRTKKAANN
ncbi:hypothetical protein O6H91_03G105100 [Diphasiastrum complanatum]|uniref:Uncharacterized protein n=1 Tax=Diphasiastrum complanatum TaxID=34168 RepID=A0ACC2EAJ4_DIPCM|nr:hypothetical protein O6H91_03G105100 [Diphasiastrum complanatum]